MRKSSLTRDRIAQLFPEAGAQFQMIRVRHFLGSRNNNIVIKRAQDFCMRAHGLPDLPFYSIAFDGAATSLESNAEPEGPRFIGNPKDRALR